MADRWAGAMTTIRVARRHRFTPIDRRTINDDRLSFRARGVLVYLLDKPDDWRTDSESIARAGCEGRDAVRAALAELELCGYLRRSKTQDAAGLWSTEIVIFERPAPVDNAGEIGLTDDGFPVVGVTSTNEASAQVAPTTGKPTTGKPTVGFPGPKGLSTETVTKTVDSPGARHGEELAAQAARVRVAAEAAAGDTPMSDDDVEAAFADVPDRNDMTPTTKAEGIARARGIKAELADRKLEHGDRGRAGRPFAGGR